MSENNILQEYISFPFDSDESYQQGLASIIAGGALEGISIEDQEEVLRRTRVFYFMRITGHSITVEDARSYEQASRTASTVSSSSPSASSSTAASHDTRTLTFAELQELIETGKVDQIPNNKLIPEAFNESPPSESITPARKKPWEVRAAAESSK